MTEEQKFTVNEMHRNFAIQLFNKTWDLLEKEDRTVDETEDMINMAHASLYHWSVIGEPINLQRGEWMLAHVYSLLNRPESALHHAQICFDLTKEHDFKDFDLAYAYEGMARAFACAVNKRDTEEYYEMALKAGEDIKRDGDKKQFMSDIKSGPWYGMIK